MKSSFHFARPVLLTGLLAGTVLLSACGQKGPLYLGKPPPERVKTQPAASAATVTTDAETPSVKASEISIGSKPEPESAQPAK